jgi:hypothetical protein
LDEFDCNVIVKRPDYHVFGMYETVSDLPVAIEDVRRQLQSASTSETLAQILHL